MFFKSYEPVFENETIDDPKADYRTAEKIGPFRLSTQALYLPDNRYLLRKSILGAIADKGLAHVTGCCAGDIPVDRVVLQTKEKKIPILCDNRSAAIMLTERLNGH